MTTTTSPFNYRIAVVGPPSSGKATQAKKLSQTLQLEHFSIGSVLQAEQDTSSLLGQYISANWTSSGEIGLALLLQDIARLSTNKGFVIEAFPKDLVSAIGIDTGLNALGLSLDYIIELRIDEEKQLESRLPERWIHSASGRIYSSKYNPPKTPMIDDETGEPLQKCDNKVNSKFVLWTARKTELENHYKKLEIFHSVDATLDSEVVYELILSFLSNPSNIEAAEARRKAIVVQPPAPVEGNIPEELKPVAVITSAIDTAIVRQIVQNTAQPLKKGRFPARYLSTLYNGNKESLQKYPYKVALMIKGVRYFLVTAFGKCYFMDRKSNVVNIKSLDVPSQFNLSILEGSLTVDKVTNKLVFVIFDVLSIGNKNVMRNKLMERLQCSTVLIETLQQSLHQIVPEKAQTQNYNQFSALENKEETNVQTTTATTSTTTTTPKSSEVPPMKIIFHEYLNLPELKTILNQRQENEKGFGLVFLSNSSHYRMGYNKDAFKWEMDSENLLDFKIQIIKKDPPLVRLLVTDQDNLSHFDFSTDPILIEKDDAVVECYWDPNFTCHIPLFKKEKIVTPEPEETTAPEVSQETPLPEVPAPQPVPLGPPLQPPQKQPRQQLNSSDFIIFKKVEEPKKVYVNIAPTEVDYDNLITRKGCWRYKNTKGDKARACPLWVADSIQKSIDDPMDLPKLLHLVASLRTLTQSSDKVGGRGRGRGRDSERLSLSQSGGRPNSRANLTQSEGVPFDKSWNNHSFESNYQPYHYNQGGRNPLSFSGGVTQGGRGNHFYGTQPFIPQSQYQGGRNPLSSSGGWNSGRSFQGKQSLTTSEGVPFQPNNRDMLTQSEGVPSGSAVPSGNNNNNNGRGEYHHRPFHPSGGRSLPTSPHQSRQTGRGRDSSRGRKGGRN